MSKPSFLQQYPKSTFLFSLGVIGVITIPICWWGFDLIKMATTEAIATIALIAAILLVLLPPIFWVRTQRKVAADATLTTMTTAQALSVLESMQVHEDQVPSNKLHISVNPSIALSNLPPPLVPSPTPRAQKRTSLVITQATTGTTPTPQETSAHSSPRFLASPRLGPSAAPTMPTHFSLISPVDKVMGTPTIAQQPRSSSITHAQSPTASPPLSPFALH